MNLLRLLKKFFSYFCPITLSKHSSAVSGTLELTFRNGQLVLDTQNTNYSYGTVGYLLYYGLKQIGIGNIRAMQHILVLGVAGGSVLKTLVNRIGYCGKLTGVEIDPDIVQIAKQYFQIDHLPNLQLVIADAQQFVQNTTERYDLIIVDIFQDNQMPDFLFTDTFVAHLMQLLRPQGTVLMNTLCLTDHDARRNRTFATRLEQHYSLKTFPKVEETNELFIIRPAQ